jgi:hypothetical protein
MGELTSPAGPGTVWLGLAVILGLLLFLLVILVIALARGWPRWAIPGVGLLVAIVYYLFLASGSMFPPQLYPWPNTNLGKLVTQTLQYLCALTPVVLLCAAGLLLAPWLPPVRQLIRRVRQDWSLPSFMLYSLALLPILLQDEYHGLGPYQAASVAILAGGAWAYLRQNRPGQRVLALLIAYWIALGALGLGIYWLYPQQPWAAYTTFPRWWEAINPLLQGPALSVVLIMPALLKLLPASPAATGAAPA